MAIERFDDETRESLMSLYEKIESGVGLEDCATEGSDEITIEEVDVDSDE